MNKVLLCILDGFGHGKPYSGNAIENANAPFLKKVMKTHPWTLLKASGEDVGIPPGTQGGSEVGHLTMGAGRIVRQPLQEIDASIADKSFFQKSALLNAAAHVKKNNSALHILGMISDQGVHADLDHALALLDFAKQQGLTKVFIHGITDGRDVPPQSVAQFVKKIEEHTSKLGLGKLVDLLGRYYAMDRDKNWDRTEVAYALYTTGQAANPADPVALTEAPLEAVQAAYQSGTESDYYLKPILIAKDTEEAKTSRIKTEDAVVFFNFRTDRAAQLTERFLKPKSKADPHPHFIVFGPYTTTAPVVFPEPKVMHNLGAVLEEAGLKQLRIGETEKYAHVTFFLNSQVKEPFPHETRIMIDSPKCPSYAEKPEMSAKEITQTLLKELKNSYAFIALNFANLDLVGHSGNYAATVRAVEAIDSCLSQLIPSALEEGYTVLLTGDHGNAEYMIYNHQINPIDDAALDGTECPSHTRNPVPFLFIAPESPQPPLTLKGRPEQITGGLRDVAPTILHLLGLKKPEEMTGSSLLA